ncbi:MAG: ATP phosphoribosyltransferase [Thermoanaerobaculia bacterium]
MNRAPDPNLPRGVSAFLFEAAARRRRAEEAVVSRFVAAGLPEVMLPVLDYAEPYRGVTAEGDERIYRFLDREGQTLSLRADFTPMAARVVAPRLSSGALPVSLFYRGDVIRDEPTGVGRAREFAQVGAERYGDPSFEADEAMLALALDCLSEIPTERLRVTLGYAGLLSSLLAAQSPDLARGDGSAQKTVEDEARERRVSSVEKRLVESGATRESVGQIARSLLSGFDPASDLFAAPVLRERAEALARAFVRARAARPGISVVADLAGTPDAPYYTGLTFAIDVMDGTSPLASGGRYDRLLGRFGTPMPALGFCVGLEALSAALDRAERSGPSRPLRLAVGKGRLLPKSLAILRAAGIELPEPDGRRLVLADLSGRVELLLLKDDDVPTYVAHGGADLGIVGSDRVEESGEEVFSPVELPFGECRLSLIGRTGEPARPNGHPIRVGTKYRRSAARFFDARKIPFEIVPLAGSVELAAALRLTDVVVDLIETGSTMAANGLEEIETIARSRAVLIAGRTALVSRREEVADLVRRLRAAVGEAS